MKIKKATLKNIEDIKQIYKIAQKHMVNEGNIIQWNQDEDVFSSSVINYINNGDFYIATDNEEIVGFFAMIYGIDNTYNQIKDGCWLNEKPYVTIHKVAVKYFKKGIASFMFNYVYENAINNNVYNVRIDTYKDNISMQKLLESHNFIKCGIISIAYDFDNVDSLRLAFQKKLK